MFMFSIKEADTQAFFNGDKLQIKVNGAPASVWLGQSPEVFFQIVDGPIQKRLLVDIGQSGDLVSFTCVQPGQSLSIISPVAEDVAVEGAAESEVAE